MPPEIRLAALQLAASLFAPRSPAELVEHAEELVAFLLEAPVRIPNRDQALGVGVQ